MRNLQEDACAVASVFLAAARTAMFQTQQYLNCLDNDVVRFSSLDMDYEPQPTGIMLELRIIQSLLGWVHQLGQFYVLVPVVFLSKRIQ
jgi:hypothetical protein